jgi:hypothetical protein
MQAQRLCRCYEICYEEEGLLRRTGMNTGFGERAGSRSQNLLIKSQGTAVQRFSPATCFFLILFIWRRVLRQWSADCFRVPRTYRRIGFHAFLGFLASFRISNLFVFRAPWWFDSVPGHHCLRHLACPFRSAFWFHLVAAGFDIIANSLAFA